MCISLTYTQNKHYCHTILFRITWDNGLSLSPFGEVHVRRDGGAGQTVGAQDWGAAMPFRLAAVDQSQTGVLVPEIVAQLGGHQDAKYTTGTRLGTSDNRGWKGLRAERWRHSEGDLGEVEVRDTKIIVMVQGHLPIRRRGDGRWQHCDAVPGTIWVCPAGVREDMVHLYGEVRESLHLFLPALPLSGTALREIDVDPDKVDLHFDGGFRDPLIEQISWTIRAEMLDPAPAGKMLVETLTSALGVHILRHHSNLESESVSLPVARGALEPQRLRRVKDFIDTHLGQDLTIETLANEASLSPFHFARAFKAATGVAPHSYVTDRRIDRAKSWILEDRRPLAEIAYLCGFSSQAYFTGWFKRLAGATPAAYRKG